VLSTEQRISDSRDIAGKMNAIVERVHILGSGVDGLSPKYV